MAKSHQEGWVVARGRKWYGYFRKTVLDPVTNAPVTDVVPIVLGLKARLTKSEAREELQKEIAKQTGQAADGRIMKDGSVTFGWVVRNRYFPLREANWKPETAKVKKMQIQRDLMEKFANVPMDVIDKFMLQTHINHLAAFRLQSRKRSAEFVLKQIRRAQAEDRDVELVLSALAETVSWKPTARARGSLGTLDAPLRQ